MTTTDPRDQQNPAPFAGAPNTGPVGESARKAERNQCDGCQAGIPLVNGTHRMGREGGYPDLMGCTSKLYT